MKIETLDIILLAVMLIAAAWTVLATRLLRSVIGLAVVSLVLTAIMYRMHSPIAAVFELSVCAGLVSAIFLSVIGLTEHMNPEEEAARTRERLRRFWILPVIMIIAGANAMSPSN
jgi:NADH-quinone oxidoreductase subunit J